MVELRARRVRAPAQRHHRAVAAPARGVGRRRLAEHDRRPAQAAARRDPRRRRDRTRRHRRRASATTDGTGAIVFALQASWLHDRADPALGAGGRQLSARRRRSIGTTTIPRCSSRTTTARPSGSPLAVGGGGAFQTHARVPTARRPPAGRGHRQRRVGLDRARELPDLVRRRAAAVDRARADVDDAPLADAGDAERRLLALVNRDRQAANLRAARVGRRASPRSRARTPRRCDATKIVAHISPTTGSAADRVRAANIQTGGRARERRARVRRRRGARRADEQPGPPREPHVDVGDAHRHRHRARRRGLGAARDVRDAGVHPHAAEDRPGARRRRRCARGSSTRAPTS